MINRSIPYHTNENAVIFQTKQPSEALEILSECKEKIIDFEVKKGTLNDVFPRDYRKGDQRIMNPINSNRTKKFIELCEEQR